LRTISAGEVKARLRSAGEQAILDVRREGEFAQGHLFFACNVPRAQLELRIERLIPRRDTPIALCGGSATETEDAARRLREFGYGDVATLEDGLESWTREGGELFSGVNVPSKAFGEFVEQAAGTPHLAPQELHAMLEAGADVVVLDARPFGEYQLMNIPGAVDCPGAELLRRFSGHISGPQTLVVVNCAGRTRSILGAQSLIDAGVANRVVALRDGTMGWHLAGYPLEHGQARRAAPPSQAVLGPARAQAAGIAERAGVRVLNAAEIDAAIAAADRRTLYLFDVRDPVEYAEGHRSGAISAPGGQLLQTLDMFVAVRNATIIVTDSDGTRAPVTAAWLRQMGESNVACAMDISTESAGTPPLPPQLGALIGRARFITARDAEARVRNDMAVVFDLASSREFRRAHIPSAMFCERHLLAETIGAAGARTIILTSPDGLLAAVAAAEPQFAGRGIAALQGGTAAWEHAGYAVESGRGNLPENPGDVYYRPYDLTSRREEAMQAYLDWEKGMLGRAMREPGVAFRRPHI
jgi:rhodanese-related sulfurtransferase